MGVRTTWLVENSVEELRDGNLLMLFRTHDTGFIYSVRFPHDIEGSKCSNAVRCGQKAAWWASVWFIWAVAWFIIEPI